MLCTYREDDIKELTSSAVSTRRVSRNRAIAAFASTFSFTAETLLQERIEPCHFPPIRPCGAAYWCSGLQPPGFSPPLGLRWRREANPPHRPNPSYQAKTSRAPNSAAAVRPMPTPMMNRAMVAVWRVVVVRWKRPMPILAMRQGAGGVGANRQGRLMLTPLMKRVVAAVVGGKPAQAMLIRVTRWARGGAPRRRNSGQACLRKRFNPQPCFRFSALAAILPLPGSLASKPSAPSCGQFLPPLAVHCHADAPPARRGSPHNTSPLPRSRL